MAETITSLIDALAEKMKTVSEQGAVLVKTFQEQAAALDDMRASAKKTGEALKGVSSSAGPVYNNTDNIAPWDTWAKVDKSTIYQMNLRATKAENAINSGDAKIMQSYIDQLNDSIRNIYQFQIDRAKIQLDAAQAAGNTDKALEIQRVISQNKGNIDNIKMQIGRIEQAKAKVESSNTATKTYRLEIKSATGTSSITVDSEAQAQALLNALGSAARLV